MGLGKRLSDALRAGRVAVQAQDLARAAIAELGPPEAEPRPESLGALVVGLGVQELAAIPPTMRAAGQAEDAFRVLITDQADIAPYQMQGFVAEYLAPPAALARAASGRDADLYLRRRLALIVDKWNLRSVLVFGPAAERLAGSARAAWTGRLRDVFAAGDAHAQPRRRITGVLK
jgi:hypothetical protein